VSVDDGLKHVDSEQAEACVRCGGIIPPDEQSWRSEDGSGRLCDPCHETVGELNGNEPEEVSDGEETDVQEGSAAAEV
jgi:hypothetical protein